MPVKRLPSHPNLDHLKNQAKDLLRQHRARELSSAQRLREFHPDFRDAKDEQIFAAPLSLSGAQLAIAREYGFASWTRLKQHLDKPTANERLALPHHERIDDPLFRRAVDLIDAGDAAGLRVLLAEYPGLITRRVVFEGENYFTNPSLLEFVAENPVRHGKLPGNIVEVARVILEAGSPREARNEALKLVATGKVSRACDVQIPLIRVLCGDGADPGCALEAAVLHGEFAAAEELMRLGAKPGLAVLAGLGRTDEFLERLAGADDQQRHLALALAAQFGRVDCVRALLDAGEDANRYNPIGAHSQSTPLHQAAYAGHMDVVRLLVERGARLDMRDVLWDGTPADWAQHGGRADVEAYLRALMEKR